MKLDEVDRNGADDMQEQVDSRKDDTVDGIDGVPKQQNEKLDEVDRKGDDDMVEQVDRRTDVMVDGGDGVLKEQNEKLDDMVNGGDGVPKEQHEKLDEVDRKGADDTKEQVDIRTDDMVDGSDVVSKEQNDKRDEVDRKGTNHMKEEVDGLMNDMDSGGDGAPQEQNEKRDEGDRKEANHMKEQVDGRTNDMDTGCDGAAQEQNEKRDEGDRKGVGDEKEELGSRTGNWFNLTGPCSLVLHRGDITKWFKDGKTDAIVNAANEMMLGGGGVDGAIHRAAGKKLFYACLNYPQVTGGVRCPIGSAVITPGFKLPVAQVIHTVGPVYHKEEDPAGILGKAYKGSIALAKKSGVKYVAFPAISCGIYGYPYEEAAKVSIQALQESAGDLLEVHFVLFEEGTYGAWLAYAEENLERLTP